MGLTMFLCGGISLQTVLGSVRMDRGAKRTSESENAMEVKKEPTGKQGA